MLFFIAECVPLLQVTGRNRVVVWIEANKTLSERVLHYGAALKVCSVRQEPRVFAHRELELSVRHMRVPVPSDAPPKLANISCCRPRVP